VHQRGVEVIAENRAELGGDQQRPPRVEEPDRLGVDIGVAAG
jgi:hypothetical protein